MFDVHHWNETERYRTITSTEQLAFLTLNLFIITFGLLGNAAVLIGSTRYRALKMDKISLVFVHNIAIADIVIIITRYIPTTVTILARDWVFGRGGCFLLGVLSNVPSCAEIITIVLLSFHRLKVLRQTPSQRLLNFQHKLRAYQVAVAVSWVFTICLWLLTATVGFEVLPGPKGTTCVIGYAFYTPDHRNVIVTGIMLTLGLLAPLSIIFTVNLYILWVISRSSSRSRTDIPTRVVATIPLICLVYFGSYITTLSYAAYLNFSGTSNPEASVEFYTVIHYLESISVLSNPVIYCIRSEFRLFLVRFSTFKLDMYSFQSVKSSDSDRLTPHSVEGYVCTNANWEKTSEEGKSANVGTDKVEGGD